MLVYDNTYSLAIEAQWDIEDLVAATQNWGSNHFVPATAETLSGEETGSYDGPDAASVKPVQTIVSYETSGETTDLTGCVGKLNAAIANVDGKAWLGLDLASDFISGAAYILYSVRTFMSEVANGTVLPTTKMAILVKDSDAQYPVGAVTRIVIDVKDSAFNSLGTLTILTTLTQ